ncbi:MAG: glycogen synthase GlgA [Eubacteriales bacterium]
MDNKKIKVLIAGAECVPFAKTGGLADVIGTLPRELRKLGVDARVIMPKHGIIKHEYGDKLKVLATFHIQLGWRSQYVGVETMEYEGVPFYFIDNEYYFYHAIYKGGETEGEQYAFFCRAVLEALPNLGFEPDILHVNDWHTAMIPMLIKTQYAHRPQGKIKTVLTIHNLQYQGAFSFDFARHFFGVDNKYLTPEFMEAYGAANYMKSGIVFADAITTVSPTYAREICEGASGRGLEGILRSRKAQLYGILNGIDMQEYDPATDKLIALNYSAQDTAGKQACRLALAEGFDLKINETTPIIGMVTRMTAQKGLDLVRIVLEELLHRDVAFVLLGSGDYEYETYFNYIAANFLGRTGVYIGYRNDLAHPIYAGCDLFLMPSQFEPCGISQMIAQRYGALPVVRETGGLADTVVPWNKFTGEGTGFSFKGYNAGELMDVLNLAIDVLKDEKAKAALMHNSMALDNSFAKSAGEYIGVYKDIMT